MRPTIRGDEEHARSEHEQGIPRQGGERAYEERMPAVSLPGGEPRERAERGRDSGSHDRRMEADREGVRTDGGERGELGRDAADAEEPDEAERTGGHCPDLEAVDGEAVVEARRTEAREQRVAEALRTPEHDRLDDTAPLAPQAERGVG